MNKNKKIGSLPCKENYDIYSYIYLLFSLSFPFSKKILRLHFIFQQIFVFEYTMWSQSVTTAFYEKKKIHLRHKWLRGQHVQLIKVGKPCYLTSKMATINGGCLFCGRLTRKLLQICLIQPVFSSFNVLEDVLNGLGD